MDRYRCDWGESCIRDGDIYVSKQNITVSIQMSNLLSVEYVNASDLTLYERNSRTHSDEQIKQIEASITEFGFTNPILIDEHKQIIAGHGRLLAAKNLNMSTVPTITLKGLTDAQKRVYEKDIGSLNYTHIKADLVADIASSIKKHQHIYPIYIDENNNVVSGAKRLAAAKELGFEKVPTVLFSTTSKSMIRNGVKDVVCGDCGNEFSVRKDTKPKVCPKCASVRGGTATKGVYQVKRVKCKAKGCNNTFRETLGYSYCSVECRKASKKIDRECKTCGRKFKTFKSALRTNASGNFCSRPCYEKFMCKEGRTTGRGSQWRKIRNAHIEKQPLCVICGTKKNLEVHHLIPFRVTQDNSRKNLVTLCRSHHKHVEYQTSSMLNEGVDPYQMRYVMKNILSDRFSALMVAINRAKKAAQEIGDCEFGAMDGESEQCHD